MNDTSPVKSVPKHYYHTDALNDSAAAFIKQMSKDDAQFFLYVAENAPHWPLQAKPADIEKYKNTYTKGWDHIRQERYKKMVAMELIDPKIAALSPRIKNELTWQNNPDKEWDVRAMGVHAATKPSIQSKVSIQSKAAPQAKLAVQAKAAPDRPGLYNEHFNARSVREGDWKLVSKSQDSTWHLYNLTVDQTELNDLAGKETEWVERLKLK